ncbi:MAG: hypothetical protein J2O49_04285, partial [Sciscionella sp.]|nr:hypothetical protein [Sciscionella sp.]
MGAHGLPTTQPATESVWAARARMAEHAVRTRHVRQPYGIPGTALGLIAWPPSVRHRIAHDPWNYWWQAHLLDCLVDAQVRDPQPARLKQITRQMRGHRLRNTGRWINDYYDD